MILLGPLIGAFDALFCRNVDKAVGNDTNGESESGVGLSVLRAIEPCPVME
jgi:hypothetical protein